MKCGLSAYYTRIASFTDEEIHLLYLLSRFRGLDGDIHPGSVSSEERHGLSDKLRVDAIVSTVIDFALEGSQTGNVGDKRVGVMTVAHDHRVVNLTQRLVATGCCGGDLPFFVSVYKDRFH